MKTGAIIIGGDYPLGSAALRKRMMHYGLEAYGIKVELLHYFPALPKKDHSQSEDFVQFLLNPSENEIPTEKKINRSVFSIFSRIKGILRVIYYLKQSKKDFLLISGGFFEGFLLSYYCRTKKMRFFIERADENRRRYLGKKLLSDYLAIKYEDLFDQYIIKKCDCLFVVSKYLEIKYREMHSGLNIVRATPSFVDIDTFNVQSNKELGDFLSLDQKQCIENDKINVVFCGSYIFHNGIDFFLECASKLIDSHSTYFQIVLVIFKGHIQLLLEKIYKLQLTKNILLIENVMSKNIPAIYKHSDILVLPEMGIEVANAGFPGKVAEYLASGKAILSTEFSNLIDFLQHDYNVMMSQIGDKHTYMYNMKCLLQDGDLRERLGRNAKHTAQKYFSLIDGIKYFVDIVDEE